MNWTIHKTTFYDWDVLSLLFMLLQQKQNLEETENLTSLLHLQIHLHVSEWSTGVSFHIQSKDCHLNLCCYDALHIGTFDASTVEGNSSHSTLLCDSFNLSSVISTCDYSFVVFGGCEFSIKLKGRWALFSNEYYFVLCCWVGSTAVHSSFNEVRDRHRITLPEFTTIGSTELCTLLRLTPTCINLDLELPSGSIDLSWSQEYFFPLILSIFQSSVARTRTISILYKVINILFLHNWNG